MWSYIRQLKAKCAFFFFIIIIYLIFITMTSASTEEFSLKQANFSPGYDEYKCVTYVSTENGTISLNTRTHSLVVSTSQKHAFLPHPGTGMTRFIPASFLDPVPEGADGR